MTPIRNDLDAFGELCASQHARLSKFREEYPDLEVVFGAALEAGRLIISSISLIRSMRPTETYRWIMWQTLFEYQKQSLLLIITANTDAGLALIRLAAELARDVAVIRDSEERLELWQKRRDSVRKREYRRIFQFDDASSVGAMAHKTYDLCSEFGVHGQVSDAMHLEPVGRFSASGRDELLVLRVSDSGVLSALQIWLTAFGSVQSLCLETFGVRHGRTLAEPHRLFMDTLEAIGPALKAITKRLQECSAKPNCPTLDKSGHFSARPNGCGARKRTTG
jgi:hypothetical protein